MMSRTFDEIDPNTKEIKPMIELSASTRYGQHEVPCSPYRVISRHRKLSCAVTALCRHCAKNDGRRPGVSAGTVEAMHQYTVALWRDGSILAVPDSAPEFGWLRAYAMAHPYMVRLSHLTKEMEAATNQSLGSPRDTPAAIRARCTPPAMSSLGW